MKRRMLAAFISSCMALGLLGCGGEKPLSDTTKQLDVQETTNVEKEQNDSLQEDGSQEMENEAADDTFESRYNEFAVKLLQQTYETGKNEMISPLSVLASLTMTENGAGGDTLSQMEQVLSGGRDAGQQAQELSAYMKSLTDTDLAHVNIANSIWVKDTESLQVKDEFLAKNEKLFDAKIYQAAFDENTLNDINAWVSDETEQMIPRILDKIEPGSMMYLINAVAFDAQWRQPYETEDVTEDIFTRENQSTEEVSFMHSTEHIYLEDENTTGFMRPYYEGYSFVALLPKEDVSVDDYVNTLSAEKLQNLLHNASYDYDVDAAIPKFKSEYSVELKDVLQKLGMKDAFDAAKADFSGIGSGDGGNLSISKVLHKTYIEVDEQGTKAGAATATVMMEAAYVEEPQRKTVWLDRPFVYAIVDSGSELPIFLGVTETVGQ